MKSHLKKLAKFMAALLAIQLFNFLVPSSATAALAKPSNVSASRDANGVVTVTWTSDGNATGYVVVLDSSGSNKNSTVYLGPSVTSIKICYQFTGGTDVWVVDRTGSSAPTLTAIEAEPVAYHYVTSGGKPACAATFTNKYDYNITLDPNTGTGTQINLVGNDYSITLPANTYTKSGYRFIGWNTNSGGTGTNYVDQATITLNANYTQILYAKWQSDSDPSMVTQAASSITSSGAVLNGKIDTGTVTSAYFCYSLTQPSGSNFVLPCADTATATASASNFSATLTGLTSGKYYFELIGVSGGNSFQGGVLNFRTLTTVTATTTAASSLSSTSGTLNGELSGLDSSLIADNYFLINTTYSGSGHLNPSTDDSITATSTYSGNPYTFNATKSGLTASTTYYFELVIVHNDNTKYFGGVLSFTTNANSTPAPVYVPHPPTIINISAPEVCAVSSQLTIKGTWLSGATAKVDAAAAQVLSSSFGELIIALPSAPVGTKTITVTNADGSATTTVKYSFADTPIYVNYIYPETYKDRAFSYTFKATDAAKYQIAGVMPAGLTLDSVTGELSGTPTQTGDYVFQIIASNICADTTLIVYMFVDKAIPDAFTCSVAFNVPASNNISDIKLAQLKNCLDKTNTLSPKYISPVIFLSGGVPAGSTAEQALTHPRYLPIISLIQSMNLNAQIYYGAFNGSTDSVQLNVYWPEPTE